jgi:hypothetical protein
MLSGGGLHSRLRIGVLNLEVPLRLNLIFHEKKYPYIPVPKWRRLLHHFYESFPIVLHYESVVVVS